MVTYGNSSLVELNRHQRLSLNVTSCVLPILSRRRSSEFLCSFVLVLVLWYFSEKYGFCLVFSFITVTTGLELSVRSWR